MARYHFAGTPADFAIAIGAFNSVTVSPNALVQFYAGPSGGSPITDIEDLTGAAIVTYRADSFGSLPEFQGPDGVLELYADTGGPTRLALIAHLALVFAAFSGLAIAGGGPWTAITSYGLGNVFKPVDGSTRIVNSPYTSGATYDLAGIDTAHSIQLSPPPSTFTQSVASGLFAPIGQQLFEHTIWVGDPMTASFDPDINGLELAGPNNITSLFAELDEPTVGGSLQVGVYRFRPGSGSIQIGTVTITDGNVAPTAATSVTRTDSATTNATKTVTDVSILSADSGRPVTGTNIPVGAYVGTVTNGVSFQLSSSPSSQVDIVATGSGSVSITLGFPGLAADRLSAVVLSAAGTYQGQGLKVRIGVNGRTFTVPADPSPPTGFSVSGTTSTTISLVWTIGTGSTATEIWRRVTGSGLAYQPYARAWNASTFIDSNVTSGVSYDYILAGRCPGAISTFTSSVTASTTNVFHALPNADGAIADPNWTMERGSSTISTASNVSSNHWTLLSGASGTSNNPQDRVKGKFSGDTGLRTAWEWRGRGTPNDTSSFFEVYPGSDNFNLTGTSALNFLQAQFSTNGCRLGGKWAAYVPGSEGTGTTGSFQIFSDSAYPTNIITGVTRVSGGVIPWGFTMTPGTQYGIKIRAEIITGGAQIFRVFAGTSAQFGTDGSSLPEIYHATLTTAQTTARAATPGSMFMQQLGHQSAVVQAESWTWDYVDVTPLSASGV